MDRITNEEVLERIRERSTLWKRRGQMMGHTLRHGLHFETLQIIRNLNGLVRTGYVNF